MTIKFQLNEQEEKNYFNWIGSHKCTFKKEDGTYKYTGAVGGLYSLKFTITTIGTSVMAECACGDKKNITDFGSW